MAKVVKVWSGREVRALREAKRLTLERFASDLGVSPRSVSKWEAGAGSMYPRPVNQHALDTFLATSDAEVQERFAQLAGLSGGTLLPTVEPSSPATTSQPTSANAEETQVRHPIDGKLMALVESGVFLAGPNNEPVWLPSFYIDIFPTSNADYARFVAAVGHSLPANFDESALSARAEHPVVFVTWRDAAAYASWATKELPTSHQWEKAARGTRGDVYPWGSQLTPAKCNVREGRIGSTTPVNRYHSGVSTYGIYDMCGNVWEWCSTESEPGRYELKGSAFTSPFSRATPSTFNDASADMFDDDTGFRCATPYETVQALIGRT